jgi:hypothetical protein
LVKEIDTMQEFSKVCKGRSVACLLGLALLSSRAPNKQVFAEACGKSTGTMREYRRGARRMGILAKEISPAIWNVELLVDAYTALCKVKDWDKVMISYLYFAIDQRRSL